VQLDHLRTFLEVHRSGALSRAASTLHLSQPAVTQHIKALESELGRPLFVRLPRGVAPTPLADALAGEITGPLDALTSVAVSFGAGAAAEDATLLLGGPADCLSERIIPALAPLTTAGMRLRVRSGLTKPLISLLAAAELDVVVATTPTRQRGVLVRPLFDETLVLVASPSIARRIDITRLSRGDPAAIAHVPLLAYAEDLPLVRRYWRSVFASTAPPVPRIVVDDLRAIVEAVVRDGGVSVIPSYLMRRELDRGDAVQLLNPPSPPTNTLYVAYRSGRQPRHVTATVEHLLALAPSWS
jgi:DNA-binding transcriptional LysR family regulator